MQKVSIVLGAGFGDEGKGNVVGALCLKDKERSIVVRFGGGHQVGHTVYKKDGTKHVFSNFGAGTMFGVPTYWSKYCTFDPMGLKNECEALIAKGINPTIFIDPEAMCVTPYDVVHNEQSEAINKHGSVGVGFGATVERNENNYHLNAVDLTSKKVFETKYKAIKDYYYSQENSALEKEFYDAVEWFYTSSSIHIRHINILKYYDNIIFEGHQGILLDQDYGFFPHVTRASTTSKNVWKILEQIENESTPDIYYVTRAYHTRHGNGFLPNEDLKTPKLKNTEIESNKTNFFQGDFRTAILDMDMLWHAIFCERITRKKKTEETKEKLVITCLDQIKNKWRFSKGNKVRRAEIKSDVWENHLCLDTFFYSNSPYSEDLVNELRNY